MLAHGGGSSMDGWLHLKHLCVCVGAEGGQQQLLGYT